MKSVDVQDILLISSDPHISEFFALDHGWHSSAKVLALFVEKLIDLF